MTDETPTPRRRWLLFAPFAAVVVLAVAWSAAWYVAAGRAEATIAAWMEQEAKLGRVYSCGSRQSGGYPFRIEVRCSDPSVELAKATPPRVLKAKELVGVAQVYQPNLIIAEIAGPLSIREAGEGAGWRADWRLAQASLRGIGGAPERVSVVLDEAKLERADGAAAETLLSANHLELHVRRTAGSTAEKPALDLAVQLVNANVPGVALLAARPLDAEATAVLRGLTDFQPKPVPMRLKEWQAAGGRLEVTKLRLRQGEAVALAAGDIGLSADGRPDGLFDITMTGFDRAVRDMVGNSALGGGMQFGLMAGLSFLGRPAEIEGKKAVAVRLRFNDGTVHLGPIRLGRVDPLY
jgi:hypothetical protein